MGATRPSSDARQRFSRSPSFRPIVIAATDSAILFSISFSTQHTRWNTAGHCPGRNVSDNHRIGPNDSAVAYCQPPHNHCASADLYAVPDGGASLEIPEPGNPKGSILANNHVISNPLGNENHAA